MKRMTQEQYELKMHKIIKKAAMEALELPFPEGAQEKDFMPSGVLIEVMAETVADMALAHNAVIGVGSPGEDDEQELALACINQIMAGVTEGLNDKLQGRISAVAAEDVSAAHSANETRH